MVRELLLSPTVFLAASSNCRETPFSDTWSAAGPAPPDAHSNHLRLLAVVIGLASSGLTLLAYFNQRTQHRIGRSQAAAVNRERARVACELHDGAIQSLIGLEMQMAAWLLNEPGLPPAATADLREFQKRLRKEIVDLRQFTQRLRPLAISSSRSVAQLVDVVTGFQRDSGIAVSFKSNAPEIRLSAPAWYEAARILQEALINVRKHSGATSVDVTFDADKRHWRLSVEDNGFGFPFKGRRAHVERDAPGNGPSVIKERVRLLGGELTIASDPGRGARLEITVPRRRAA